MALREFDITIRVAINDENLPANVKAEAAREHADMMGGVAIGAIVEDWCDGAGPSPMLKTSDIHLTVTEIT